MWEIKDNNHSESSFFTSLTSPQYQIIQKLNSETVTDGLLLFQTASTQYTVFLRHIHIKC